MPARLRLADLKQRKAHAFDWAPDRAAMAAIAADLDLIDLRKARLSGRLLPVGKADWDLEAKLGATVTQPCVATLAPVRTRIDEPVLRRYRADADEPPTAGEIEMPEDDTLEPLLEVVDLSEVFREALSLALPTFPRIGDAPAVNLDVAEPGVTPMTDADARPFAGLAGFLPKRDGDTD
ncbi:MAG: DUF177 domain-containing protein [Mangrovicoccus sp.]|nr:DUF177 domain-containing protein [Mangrovicoccus sp.]